MKKLWFNVIAYGLLFAFGLFGFLRYLIMLINGSYVIQTLWNEWQMIIFIIIFGLLSGIALLMSLYWLKALKETSDE